MRTSALKLYSQSREEDPTSSLKEDFAFKDAQVSPIREELVELTGNHSRAVVLNQLLYWTPRVKDFDLMLEEERSLGPYVEQGAPVNGKEQDFNLKCHVSPRHGWIYKTAHELIKETLLTVSHPTMRKYLKQLIEQGWIEERSHPLDKWNKTTQYRVNLRKLQKELIAAGRTLPNPYLRAFSSSSHAKVPSNSPPKISLMRVGASNESSRTSSLNCPAKAKEISNVSSLYSNVKNLHSEENSLASNEKTFHPDEISPTPSLNHPAKSEENPNERNLHSNVRNFGSNERNLHSDVRNFPSNVKNLHSYTYTETTTKNTNREHTQEACASEVFKNSVLMVEQWGKHIGQEVRLTEERKHQLEGLYRQHFQSDLVQWTEFCQRIQASPFLMGEGARKWRVSLDWILSEGNALKVLEGNFDDPERLQLKKSEGTKINQNQERADTLASIQEPTWQDWCTQLSCRNQQKDPVSLFALKEIVNASFTEFDGRLVWIESEYPKTLNRINDLRLQLLTIAQKSFPQARNIRTQLKAENPLTFSSALKNDLTTMPSTTNKGEVHAE